MTAGCVSDTVVESQRALIDGDARGSVGHWSKSGKADTGKGALAIDARRDGVIACIRPQKTFIHICASGLCISGEARVA